MTLDARAYTWCNLGPLSEEGASIAEDHAQGTGVIMVKGIINLVGIHRPVSGTVVKLAYSDGQNWIAQFPLRLLVLSCFSDPIRNKTSVSVGCDFAFYDNRKEPVTVDAEEEDDKEDVPDVVRRVKTPSLTAGFLALRIFGILGIPVASGIPLSNSYTKQGHDMSGGYVEELSKLCASEGYVCYMNINGAAEIVSKDVVDPGTSLLLTQDDLIDLNPINVGELPGDAVYGRYTSLRLKEPEAVEEDPTDPDPTDPENEDEKEIERQKRDWELEEVVGQRVVIDHDWTLFEVKIVPEEFKKVKDRDNNDVCNPGQEYPMEGLPAGAFIKEGKVYVPKRVVCSHPQRDKFEHIPYEKTKTSYDDKDRAVYRRTERREPYGLSITTTKFTYKDVPPPIVYDTGEAAQEFQAAMDEAQALRDQRALLDPVADQVKWNKLNELIILADQKAANIPLGPRPKPETEDNGELLEEVTLETKPLGPICMSLGLEGSAQYVKSLGSSANDDQFYPTRTGEPGEGEEGRYISSKRRVVYNKNAESGITKTITTNLVPYMQTTEGSEVLSRIRDRLDPYDSNARIPGTYLVGMAIQLVESGSEVRIRTEREFGIERRPTEAERKIEESKKEESTSSSSDAPGPPDVQEQTRLAWAVGSATSQTAIELSPPYAPDDRIVGSTSGPPWIFSVIPGNAAVKVVNYGRIENRYLFGHRNGVGIQVLPESLPPKPLSVVYIRLKGCTGAFLVNGRTWNLDPSGATVTCDALFWGAIDGNATDAWFPMPPNLASLPAPVAVTTNANPVPANAIPIPSGFDFQNPNLNTLFGALPANSPPIPPAVIAPAIIIKPYHETIFCAAGSGSGCFTGVQFWVAQPAGEYLAGSGSGVLAETVTGPSTSLGARWTSGSTFTGGAATGIAGGGVTWTSDSTFTAGAGSSGLVLGAGAQWTSATTFSAGAAEDGLELGAGATWTSGSVFTAGDATDGIELGAGAQWTSATAFTAGAGDDGIERAEGATWSSGSVFIAGAGSNGLVEGAGAVWSSSSVFTAGAGSNGIVEGQGVAWISSTTFVGGAGSNGVIQGAGATWSSATAFTAGAGSSGIVQGQGATWISSSLFTAGAGNNGMAQGSGTTWTSGSVFLAGAGSVVSSNGAGATWSSTSTFKAGRGNVSSTTDPDFDKVVLLLHFDGDNNSTTFIDSSSYERTITPVGDAKISTARFMFGGASGAFDALGDRVTTTVEGGLGAEAFTIEFVLWRPSTANYVPVFNSRTNTTGSDGIDIFADGRVGTFSNWIFGDLPVPQSVLPVGEPSHIAITRTAQGVMRRWIRGNQYGPDVTVANVFSGTFFQVGGSGTFNTGSLNSNIDEFRVTVGIDRYSEPFAPPSEPFPEVASPATFAYNIEAITLDLTANAIGVALDNGFNASIETSASQSVTVPDIVISFSGDPLGAAFGSSPISSAAGSPSVEGAIAEISAGV